MNKKLISIVAGISLAVTSSAGILPWKAHVSKVAAATTQTVSTQKYKWDNVKIEAGGYVPAVIFNKTEKGLVYARTDMGGAYRFDVKNNKWVSITDGFADWTLQGCESIATDPIDTNRVYIAAGLYTNDWQNENGYILSSKDKGNTWQKYELPFKVGGNMPGRNMGERLQIDPNDDKILYLGARSGNGLWRSEDYGQTWSKVDSFTDTGDFVQDSSSEYTADKVGVVWETFDPTTGTKGSPTQTIYVGTADKTGNNIYVSHDAGKTWNPIKGEPTGYLPQHGILNSEGMLYVSYNNNCGPYVGTDGEVWKYNTKTGEWTNITPPPVGDSKVGGYGGIAVDAQHPDTVIVATLNRWWPDEEIYRSTDAGKTWKPIWDWAGYPNRNLNYNLDYSKQPWLDWGKTGVTPPDPLVKLGWMMGDLEIDPFNSDRMFYGTGATLYGTDDLTNWDKGKKIDISVKADGIEECAVNDVVCPSKGAQLLSGVGDNCGFYHEDITKVPSRMMTTPTFNGASSIDYAENVPNFVVRVGDVDTSKNSQDKDCGVSYDGGKDWNSVGSNIQGVYKPGTVAVSPDAKTIVWSPAEGASPAYSTDTGASWTTCKGLPQAVKVRSDRVNPKKFYAFGGGKFYVSTDGGATFTASAASLPKTNNNIFKTVIGHEGDIWISGEKNGLLHSTDSGATFTKVSGVDDSETVGFGKSKTDGGYPAIYMNATISGTTGVFRSDDEGATWTRINDDDHQYGSPNYCITGDPNKYGRVYFGTNGRGVIYGDIDESKPPVVYGDINGDNVVNVNDLILLKKYLKDSSTKINLEAADLNGDGSVNVLDVILMKEYLSGKITKFPAASK
ncbi:MULTISPECIES: dockerin type I domain-containing protein [Clostridium]|uniref:dockerin type I domain-containing protein n=1 Tax=Clostridium TaxID=1485 RepID=UPI0008250F51|nr:MULTISPECIES: dockerin type I domain-containing protein [Clostridium]PJI07417.1 xyloglucanase [Clostridium sp. CT7]